ncbi:iron complex outermembrane recepter protein [Kushneria avicenniae]|uniref:Iron complex outermembrane recepter protein n=1 Tax=Kushneria avicenniae TaxID=402385 RepID=A0A1I1LK96_9GAMM|nr:TonB-dependent siderophore receptor [Kushneria avicenniae]SFC73534.1 iron complex outermembrane recepter protein [Kushneria avicenniae]
MLSIKYFKGSLKYLSQAPLLAGVVLGGWSVNTLAQPDDQGTDTMVITGQNLSDVDGPTQGYSVQGSDAGTKTATPLAETARTINVVTRQQLDDQGITNINDALLYTPGAFTGLAGASKRSDVVSLRGFHGGDVDNTFLDGMRLQSDPGAYSAMQIDPFFLERVDVVKGPASSLYGRTMPGGMVSMTTKKPQSEQQGLFRLYGGSFDTYGAGIDVTGPLSDPSLGAYRITALGSSSDTQFDVAKRERYAIMPQITLTPTEDTDLTLQAYLQHDPAGDYHGAVPYDLSVSGSRFGGTVDSSWSDADPANDVFRRNQRIFSYQLQHRFSDNLTFNSRARYTNMDVEVGQVYQVGFTGNGAELARGYSGSNEDLQAFSTDNNLQYEIMTGEVEHTLLAGFDYQRRKNDAKFSSAPTQQGASVRPLDPFNPDYSGNSLSGEPGVYADDTRKVQQGGIYLQDQMRWNRWNLTLGGRQDFLDREYHSHLYGNTDSRNDKSFSGSASLLYRFDSGIAPYYSYSEAFNPSPDSSVDGLVPEPVDSQQHEIGVKYQPPGTDDLYQIAFYDLTQENVQQRTTVSPVSYISAGDIRSRGVELSANAALTDRLRAIAGYSYNDIEYRDSVSQDGVNIESGNTPVLSPEQTASLWMQYDFPRGVRGGVGGRYVKGSYANADNTRKTGDYTLADAFVSVDLGEFSNELNGATLKLNATNLFDKKHVTGCFSENYCYFGDERQVTATLDYRF